MMRRGSLTLAVAAALVLGLACAGMAATKVAVVDMQRAIRECKAGKRAAAQLRKRKAELEAELKALSEKLTKLRKELENTAMLLKPEVRLKKQRAYERMLRRFNDRRQEAQQELIEAQRDALGPIQQRMLKVVREIGAARGYSMVLDARFLYYFPRSVDITAEVVAAYDKKYK